jgi:hypothetical protein
MLRAVLVALGLSLGLMWLVGVIDGSTTWLTWLDGIIALSSLGLALLFSDRSPPLASAAGLTAIGLGLLTLFIIGVATHASGWLVWFTLAFAAGYLLFAALVLLFATLGPRLDERHLGELTP